MLGASDQALLAQLIDDHSPRLLDARAHEPLGRLVGDTPVLADNADLPEPVAASDLEVVRVVPRGDLERPGAEVRLDVLVRDDLQLAPDKREDRGLTHEPAIAVIVGVDG